MSPESHVDDPWEVGRRARRYCDLGRYADAERLLRRALHAAPEHVELLNWLSFSLHKQGRSEEDLDVTDKALGIDPDEPVLYYRRGWTLWALGRREEAIEHLRRGLELDPHNELRHFLHRDLCRFLNWNKEHADALDIAEAGLRDFPGDAELLLGKGEALRRLDCNHEAQAPLLACLEVDPGNGTGWYTLALNNMELSRARPSLAAFVRSMSIDPDDEWRAERVRYFMTWPLSMCAESFRWSLPLAALGALLLPSGFGRPILGLLGVTLAYTALWWFRGGVAAWRAVRRLNRGETAAQLTTNTCAYIGLVVTVTAILIGDSSLAAVGLVLGVLLWPALAFDYSLNPNEDHRRPMYRRVLGNLRWQLRDDFTGNPRRVWRRLRHKVFGDKAIASR